MRRDLILCPLAAALACAPLAWATRAWAADPVPYTVTIAKTGNAGLDGALTGTSTLDSLNKTAPVGSFALVARARGDEPRLLAALQSYGYYKAHVTVTINGRSLDDVALPNELDAAPAKPPAKVAVAVTPGPLFHVGHVTLHGAVPDGLAPSLGLASGAPAMASDVLAAAGRLLTALRDHGYALATVADPVATLAPGDTLDVSYAVHAGPRTALGPIAIQGLKDVHERFVRRRLLIHTGERFNPNKIEAARQDMIAAGVFSSVRMVPAKQLDAQGQLPITMIVAERPRHAVAATVDYSTDLGAGASVTWQHRNLFGNAETLALTAGFNAGGSAERAPGYNAGAVFQKPDFYAHDQTLRIDVGAVRESLDAYMRTAITGDIGVLRKLNRHWTVGVGLSAEQERIVQEGVTRNYTLVGLPLTAAYDSTDNQFDPTRGIRAAASVTPTESLGSTNATFVLTQVAGSTYLDVSPLWAGAKGHSIIAVRALLGEASGASQFELPPDKRFYAGGTATVRGYRYQSVGPLFADGRPQGGTGVAAGTVELRQRIIGNFGAAAFVDAGEVSTGSSPFGGTVRIGAGMGARYYTSIGPIRLDVAVPLGAHPSSDSLEIYIGIGQAF